MFKKLFFGAALSVALLASANANAAILKDIDGNTVDTSQLYNDGKPMVVSFWATWCKPCIRELNAIKEVYPDWQDETGVRVIAVSIDEAQNAERARTLATGKGWEYQVLLDPNGEFKRELGVTEPPHVFVLNPDGSVAWNHKGYVDGSEDEIFEQVKKVAEK